MGKTRLRRALFLGVISLLSWRIEAAFLREVPRTLVQPDGTEIQCFVSGDEFYHWVHDARGYVIVRNPSDGFCVYADKRDGQIVSTSHRVGGETPETLGIRPGLLPDPVFIQNQRDVLSQGAPALAPPTGSINNLVIFIRFSDQTEYTKATSTYDGYFNTNTSSLKGYFAEASYNQVDVSSTFYPIPPGSTVISYTDSHLRGYFSPYEASTNPIGYTGGDGGAQRTTREHTLLKNAVDFISSQVPIGLNIDTDSDGYVDNVCFIIRGSVDDWGNLLWPHRWTLETQTATILGKRVWDYNLQLENSVAVGVLCHEMFHSMGSPDLYHYTSCSTRPNISPVGRWDLMDQDTDPPQHMGAHMKLRYGTWIGSIPEITAPGTYTLSPLSSPSNNAYLIRSPYSTTEHFVVEYRQKTGTFESSVPGSGLLIYRINDWQEGNRCGPPDEVYLYRPDGTVSVNGDPDNAHLSSDVGRTVINDTTNPSSFLGNGAAGGLKILNVTAAGSTISFDVLFLATATPTATLVPTATATSTCSPTATPTNTSSPTATPTATATPTPVWSDVGWVQTRSETTLSSLVLYGDRVQKDMAGLPAGLTPETQHILCHFRSSARWYTGVVVANPNPSVPAHVSLTAHGDNGNILATAMIWVPGNGKVSALVSDPSLFGPGVETGWIELVSDLPVFAFDLYGDVVSGGIAALPSSSTGSSLSLPHFHCSSRWWTGLSVVNPGTGALNVTVKAYTAEGLGVTEETIQVPSKGKVTGFVKDMMGFTGDQTGWLSLTSSGGEIAGMVLFGDRQASPNQIAAVSAGAASLSFNFSGFRSDAEWWTGISVVNPASVGTANVRMSAWSSNGSLIRMKDLQVLPLNKVTGFVDTLFSTTKPEGWVSVSSDLPLAAQELVHANDVLDQAWGLAGVEPQGSGQTLSLTHYAISSKWWTLFWLANPGVLESPTTFMAYGNNGVFAGHAAFSILPGLLLSVGPQDLF